jgi:SSS family solute:Na+ symporter
MYVTIGGLWADTANDFFQFCVQVAAGIVMFAVVWSKLAERGLNYMTMWKALPAGQTASFRDPYTLWFALPFVLVVFLSYNGGTWNLAARYLASPTGCTARKASLLSGSLYLLWPLVMFAPLWAAPLLIPGLGEKAAKSVYSMMATQYLPAGLVGLVLASMFAATLSMVASDSNAVSSVVARDILPVLRPSSRRADGSTPLAFARFVTFVFTLLTLVIALNNERFGGILGLIIKWFGGLVGPASIPMVFGLLPVFRRCGPRTAWAAILGGFGAFAYVNFGMEEAPLALSIAAPVTTSLVIFVISAIAGRDEGIPDEVNELMDALSRDAGAEPA